jgi:hypothetical protein
MRKSNHIDAVGSNAILNWGIECPTVGTSA